MSENKHINSIIRLRNILTKASTASTRDVQNPNLKITCRGAWTWVFDIESEKSEDLLLAVLENMIELRQLFDEVIQAIQDTDDFVEHLHLAPIVKMSGIVKNLDVLNEPWENYIGALSTENLTALRYIEHHFAKHIGFSEQTISDNDIESILDELNGIYEQIIKSNLPYEFKADLLDVIQELRTGVHQYRVRGAIRLKESIAKSFGVLVVNGEAVEKNKGDESIDRLLKIMDKINKLYSFATKAQPLLNAATGVIPKLLEGLKG